MRYNYTKNNHLKYYIGNREFGKRENSTELYSVKLGAIDNDIYRTSNYVQELRRTADSVYKEFGKNLVVFLSGGTDSEIVVRNFLSIGIKPTCVTINFIGGYNEPDVFEAKEISRELDLDLKIVDFDLQQFFYSGQATEFGNEIQCTQITYLMVYHNILKLGQPAVMGGESLFTRSVSPNNTVWYYTLRENEDASAMRFSEKCNIPLVNEWFSYTPELLLYFMEDYQIQCLFNDRYNYKLSSVSIKNSVLKRLYPDIRPKIKTHGFERLLGFNYEVNKAIAVDQIKRLEPSIDGIPVQQALDMLRGIT